MAGLERTIGPFPATTPVSDGAKLAASKRTLAHQKLTPSIHLGHAALSAATRDQLVSRCGRLALMLRDHGFDQRVLRGGLNDALQPKPG